MRKHEFDEHMRNENIELIKLQHSLELLSVPESADAVVKVTELDAPSKSVEVSKAELNRMRKDNRLSIIII